MGSICSAVALVTCRRGYGVWLTEDGPDILHDGAGYLVIIAVELRRVWVSLAPTTRASPRLYVDHQSHSTRQMLSKMEPSRDILATILSVAG